MYNQYFSEEGTALDHSIGQSINHHKTSFCFSTISGQFFSQLWRC